MRKGGFRITVEYLDGYRPPREGEIESFVKWLQGSCHPDYKAGEIANLHNSPLALAPRFSAWEK